jgi:SprT protein
VKPAEEGLEAAICRRTRELLAAAAPLCRRHRVRVPDPDIRFDLRGLAAGQVRWNSAQVEVRYNLAIARRHRSDFLARTVTHEVAHVLTVACHGRTAPHGAEWQAMMRFLGVANPDRCHDYAVDEGTVRRQRRWPYRCACGVHQLSTTRHRRVQNGAGSYLCRRCKMPLRLQEPLEDGPKP